MTIEKKPINRVARPSGINRPALVGTSATTGRVAP
jgi:hypothetical protein